MGFIGRRYYSSRNKGIIASLFCILLFSAGPLYPQRNTTADWPIIAGTSGGLFGIDWSGKSDVLWSGGQVKKIIKSRGEWIILGSAGIFASRDLKEWENRSQGLPVKKIKIVNNGEKSFLSVIQEIKDIALNPLNHDVMACATKDQVFVSRNQGVSWQNLGAPPFRTNGIKAVAAANLPDGENDKALIIFVAHSTYGFYYLNADNANAKWIEISNGLELLETSSNTDEVSDIAVMADDNNASVIFVSQTFRRRIYRLDWEHKAFIRLWGDNPPFGTVDSLDPGKTKLRFIREGAIAQINYSGDGAAGGMAQPRPDLADTIKNIASNLKVKPDCVLMRENRQRDAELVTLSELWLLSESAFSFTAAGNSGQSAPPAFSASSASAAWGKEGLYLPVNHAMDDNSLKPYLDIISSRGLNMVVIDMKDDYGRLRWTPNNPDISAKGRVFRPLDIEALLAKMKLRGIYTVARIVVFKDPVLAARNDSKYAVWDRKNNKPWAGYRDVRRKKPDEEDESEKNDLVEIIATNDPEYEIVRTYYDERWVDPYSEEVWEYISAISVELASRGFDEIQFDYIRFPTDGINLADARYRWQDSGMDMESAILSFLRHIRSRVKAPISIDIYGANGWYRTGARTGQEVELLAPWVDVICPMYYPSHFEQNFLAQPPEEMRPYRIYSLGTMRTARIGRGQIIVRPWIQAFYLNVSFDRKYYNLDYVRRQIEGVRDAGNPGFTYWNNSGRYDDIPQKNTQQRTIP